MPAHDTFIRRVKHKFCINESIASDTKYRYVTSSYNWYIEKSNWMIPGCVFLAKIIDLGDNIYWYKSGYVDALVFESCTTIIGKYKPKIRTL